MLKFRTILSVICKKEATSKHGKNMKPFHLLPNPHLENKHY